MPWEAHEVIGKWVYKNIAWPKHWWVNFGEACKDLDSYSRRSEVSDHHQSSVKEEIMGYAERARNSFIQKEEVGFQYLADALHLVVDRAIPHEVEKEYDKKAKGLSKEERERILREARSLCERWKGEDLAQKLEEILDSPDDPLSKAMKASYFLAWRVVKEAKVEAVLGEVRRRPFLPGGVIRRMRRVGKVVRGWEWFKIEAKELVHQIEEAMERIIRDRFGEEWASLKQKEEEVKRREEWVQQREDNLRREKARFKLKKKSLLAASFLTGFLWGGFLLGGFYGEPLFISFTERRRLPLNE